MDGTRSGHTGGESVGGGDGSGSNGVWWRSPTPTQQQQQQQQQDLTGHPDAKFAASEAADAHGNSDTGGERGAHFIQNGDYNGSGDGRQSSSARIAHSRGPTPFAPYVAAAKNSAAAAAAAAAARARTQGVADTTTSGGGTVSAASMYVPATPVHAERNGQQGSAGGNGADNDNGAAVGTNGSVHSARDGAHSSPSPPLQSAPLRSLASTPLSDARAQGAQFVQMLQSAVDECCDDPDDPAPDAVWHRIQEEARDAAAEEPLLASYLFATVLNHRTLEESLALHLANKLSSTTLPNTLLVDIIKEALRDSPVFRKAVRKDLLAIADRDPACSRVLDALLFFKGFHALETYRVSNWLWHKGRRPMASYLQSQLSKEFQIDIHPAATFGYGIFLDHGTGIVVGETAVVGNNVSMLHHVTLGGTGTRLGVRHPTVCDGVLIGAGATILGNITVGEGAMVGACTLLTQDLPPHSTAVGVPARIVGAPRVPSPSTEMDQDVTHCMALMEKRKAEARARGESFDEAAYCEDMRTAKEAGRLQQQRLQRGAEPEEAHAARQLDGAGE